MQINIEIKTGNAAFDHPAAEVSRIVSVIAQKIASSIEEHQHEYGDLADYIDSGVEFDFNGNAVCDWEVMENQT